MTNVVELSEKAYQKLQRVAQEEGVTPSEWLEARLPDITEEPPVKSAAEALAPYIGSVDSREHTPDPKYRSAFGDILDEKYAKQGINPPKWPS